ncbi:MAG: metallophosphoesterase [Pseudomonadales bacterium]|nr:metallophosphoesterase [Pseudomonadales bacterium]
MSKIAIIGDVHSFWNDFDIQYFNNSDYDYLLFTGDLPRFFGGVSDAKKLAALSKPAFVIPGNHDGSNVKQFVAELRNKTFLSQIFSRGQGAMMQSFNDALGKVTLTGFSAHPLPLFDPDVGLIAARPHSMGGNRLYFQPYLKRQFQVSSIDESTKRLKQLVDQSPRHIIFLAHNGPRGLGNNATDIWGCDFNPSYGDFGDEDLQAAVEYAEQQGKRVLAVIAGHMHQRVKKTRLRRQWFVLENDTAYINAAHVPRIFNKEDKKWHHHISLQWENEILSVSEILLTPQGDVQTQAAELATS